MDGHQRLQKKDRAHRSAGIICSIPFWFFPKIPEYKFRKHRRLSQEIKIISTRHNENGGTKGKLL